jgi:hypothetical protein
MNREQIRKVALNRMTEIEDRFNRHVPFEIQQYYLLLHLIVYGLDQYTRTYGLQMLDEDCCREGKNLAGYGHLSLFETDCAKYINTIVETKEREQKNYQTKVISLRPIG